MALFLIVSTFFAVLTLVLLIAYFATGAKNNTLRYLAGASGILSSLMWLIKSGSSLFEMGN